MGEVEEFIVEVRVRGTLKNAEDLADLLSEDTSKEELNSMLGLELLDTAVYKASLVNKVEEGVENAG
jgi:hypothetical protein